MWNWLNIRILEDISKGAEKEIEEYKETIFKKKLVVEDFTYSKVPECFIWIKEKWNKVVKDIVIQDIIYHQTYIEAKLNVKSCLLLHHIIPGESWVEIHWLLSNYLVDYANESAKNNNHNGLFKDEVFYLSIGKYIIRDLCPGKLVLSSIYNYHIVTLYVTGFAKTRHIIPQELKSIL